MKLGEGIRRVRIAVSIDFVDLSQLCGHVCVNMSVHVCLYTCVSVCSWTCVCTTCSYRRVNIYMENTCVHTRLYGFRETVNDKRS